MSFCYPTDTDWGCVYTDDELEAMRADEAKSKAMDRSEALAWYTLASLCAYQIGVCPTVIRPCSAGCAPAGSWTAAPVGSGHSSALPLQTIGTSFTPHVRGGVWVNGCGCSSGDSCGCGAISEVILPGPVGDIVSVQIDGEEVPAAEYRVDNGNRLVSLNSDRKWPTCQNLTAAAGDPGSFVVTYYQGAAPNELTRFAAGILAAEFYKACMKDSKCRLPRGVRTVTRGNATYDIDTQLFADGFTKIPEVDAVIRIYNPHTVKQASQVFSPDAGGRVRRVTWGVY